MKRKASAKWNGNGLEGKGVLTSTSGVLNSTPYSFAARFKDEDGKSGTNPEELVAAAHAGCFTMALSFQIAGAGFTADELVTDAAVNFDQGEGGFSITGITLKVTGKVSGMSEEKFIELANVAKAGCPISKALSAVPITLEAKFVK
ncbi:OsmC family protein [Alistipes sp. ZOR0009]|jgi:osmotically inducible protein OsmC|uniref:OsmC family protein n=1 Tax=Alistipes sp. ZOR0009 TaxID=1339253 RepID=UPI000648505A|nr:OsmC family protein [Alistipes sp. ZOR0009]